MRWASGSSKGKTTRLEGRGLGRGDTGESTQKNPLGSEVALSRSLEWEGAGLERLLPFLWGSGFQKWPCAYLIPSQETIGERLLVIRHCEEFPLSFNSHSHPGIKEDHLHFTAEETEAWRADVTCPQSQSR